MLSLIAHFSILQKELSIILKYTIYTIIQMELSIITNKDIENSD